MTTSGLGPIVHLPAPPGAASARGCSGKHIFLAAAGRSSISRHVSGDAWANMTTVHQ